MDAQKRKILSMGLGRFAAYDPNAIARFGPDTGATVKQLLQSSIDKANAAGFEVVTVDANPQDPEDTLKRLAATLKDGNFVGINIGFGLRGHKENTELFENVLNKALEIRPGIKIMFSNGPDQVITAIQRSFPDAF